MNRCRPYVPARALWGAATAEAARLESGEGLVVMGLVFKNDKGTFTDRFRGRVMFPIYSFAGKVIGFGGRILEKNDKLAKYINSPESEIYNKSKRIPQRNVLHGSL